MVEILKASPQKDIEALQSIRLEMLRIVNNMDENQCFDGKLIDCSRNYFLGGDQTTVLAKDGSKAIGCASLSYINIMPTYDHPTGRRAHLMNVYTNSKYRRQGIARKMVLMLIDEAKVRGCTEISLDATEAGKPLYKNLGFTQNDAGMVLELKEASECNTPCTQNEAELNIGIIGYGSMGKMLAGRFLESKIIPEQNLFVSNRSAEKLAGLKAEHPAVHACSSNKEAAEHSDIIFLCVRPADMKTVLTEIQGSIRNTHIVSLNGSISFSLLEGICSAQEGCRISKAIPSVTAEVNASQTLVCHNSRVTEKDRLILKKMLSSFGSVIELPESETGMGSELVSCMPGFIAALFREIADEAQKHTAIPKNQIVRMLLETVTATGRLMLEKDLSFEAVVERVATKGGITQEGTKVIEADFPATAKKLFENTLQKRSETARSAERSFGEAFTAK